MFAEAARTRARRRIAPKFFKDAANRGTDVPTNRSRSRRSWARTSSRRTGTASRGGRRPGSARRIPRPPTDLFAYQELIHKLRPDWIIETRAGDGGRALFLATVCDLVGHGQVISIERKEAPKRPEHERHHYITGVSVDDEVVDEVHSLVGTPGNALVILGTAGTRTPHLGRVRLYSDLVPVGAYVIVEDTIVNGHPVWPNFGPGPAEAVKGIVERRENFAIDVEMNKYRLSFNPNGFLRRMS